MEGLYRQWGGAKLVAKAKKGLSLSGQVTFFRGRAGGLIMQVSPSSFRADGQAH